VSRLVLVVVGIALGVACGMGLGIAAGFADCAAGGRSARVVNDDLGVAVVCGGRLHHGR